MTAPGILEVVLRDNQLLDEQRRWLETPGNWLRPLRVMSDPSDAVVSTPADALRRAVRHILCPIDSSDGARRALSWALQLARQHNAKLTVLQANEHVQAAGKPKHREVFLGEWSRDGYADLVVVTGTVLEPLLQCAAELPADLIVIGAGRSPDDERLPVPSLPERLLLCAPCPVLAIPIDAGDALESRRPFGRVLCATDFSPASSQAVFLGAGLANGDLAELHLLHVVEGLRRECDYGPYLARDGQLEALRAHVASMTPANVDPAFVRTHVIIAAPAATAILEQALRVGAELIGVGAASRAGYQPGGSTTWRIVSAARCPVLVARGTRQWGRERRDLLH